jgi:hypothetical protein
MLALQATTMVNFMVNNPMRHKIGIPQDQRKRGGYVFFAERAVEVWLNLCILTPELQGQNENKLQGHGSHIRTGTLYPDPAAYFPAAWADQNHA